MLCICDFDTSEKIFITSMSNFILKDQTTPKFEAVNKKNIKPAKFQMGFMFSFPPSGNLPD